MVFLATSVAHPFALRAGPGGPMTFGTMALAYGLTNTAWAESPGYQSPNSIVGVSAGTPLTLSLRGEAWMADEIEGELGVGFRNLDDLDLGFDYAVRWRPDIGCIGCGGRVLLSLGVGPGGLVLPPPGFDGAWSFAVGGDLGANLVFWMSPTVGLDLSVRGGGGAAWTGTDLGDLSGTGWVMGTVGLAF